MNFEDIMKKMFDDFKAEIIEGVADLIKKSFSLNINAPLDEVVWLRPAEARLMMGIKSRNSWKKLRQSGEVDYTRVGREYQYTKQSLLAYKAQRSTLKYKVSIQSPKNKFYGKK